MAAILDFTHNAMNKVRSGHTRMSDILENPMAHTKICLCFYSVQNDINNYYCFTLHKWRPSRILFTMQCIKYFLITSLCRA